jgi:hypothetical protein
VKTALLLITEGNRVTKPRQVEVESSKMMKLMRKDGIKLNTSISIDADELNVEPKFSSCKC